MKSRSNRHPISDPPDDWVDGSWTVDCICGVNFDDGEEMVNCDECAVWVHTRCVRFVKGEKSFSCDKCKSKASRINNDSEETEVAQLLVELPTKTIKMSSGNNNVYSTSNSYAFSNHPPPPPPPRRPPYRLWAHRPMEERVHVQGVPGGADDPSLFQGFPILFGPELWKCSGYVPKKFNFRYREFPCWEKEQGDGEDEAKDGSPENVIDKGADVLYSLSKENVVVSMRGQSKGGASERKGSKERKLENGDSKKISSPGLSKKEKGTGRSIVLHCSSKRSKEGSGSLKDRGGKKKSKASHKEQDGKKNKFQGLKAVVIHSTSARQAEVCESKAHKVASITNLSEGSSIEKPKRNAATDEGNLVLRSPEVSGLGCSSEKRVKAEKPGLAATDSSQKSAKTEVVPQLVVEKDNNTINSIKKEGFILAAMYKNQGALPVVPEDHTNDFSKPKPHAEDVDNSGLEVDSTGVAKEVEATVSLTSGHCVGKTESDIDNSDGVLRSHPSDIDVELHCSEQISSLDRECEDSKRNETVATTSQPLGHEVQDNDKALEAVSGSQLVKDEELMENQCNNKLKCESSENFIEVQRTLSDSKEVTRVAGEISKSSGEVLPPPASHHKIVSFGKSSPSSSTIVISRSCLSDKNRAGGSQNHSSIGKRVSNFSMPKKENAPLGQAKDEDKYEKTKGILKDHSKSCTNAGLKASQPSKPLMSPGLKHHISLGKDPSRHSSSKKSTDGAVLPSNIDETSGTQQTQHASTLQSKNTASAGQNRGEKVLPNSQSSSKSTQPSLGHLPTSSCAPAGLSDEELALLLHQELNSSPRVPRVPRVRNAGNLPQLSSASATSIFNKRSASSGGKDQQTFSRRKNKDGSRNSRELDNEARKVDRAPSSPDSVKTSDALTHAESESIHSVRKNVEDVSTSAANSGPSSNDANEQKSSSARDSPVNKPEDDTGTNKGLAPIHRTLPGLIAEIMGAGRRMTYEELCNAVLPHWQNLRKHNGERYAYSSHSQAVLDCLRNRSEWSRLVDRGPKTSTSRKKRKVDVEPPNTESEDGEDRTVRSGKSKSFDSNKDEFPKGRRKARKRRRLALRGRGVKDDGKRTKKGAGSGDSGTFSNSSEDSGSSDDDSQGSGHAAKSEVSASSADIAAS